MTRHEKAKRLVGIFGRPKDDAELDGYIDDLLRHSVAIRGPDGCRIDPEEYYLHPDKEAQILRASWPLNGQAKALKE